jgi:hypothetical protein
VTFKVGIMDAALGKNVRDRMAHGFAHAQLTLRAAGSGTLLVMAGHGRFLNGLMVRDAQQKLRSSP